MELLRKLFVLTFVLAGISAIALFVAAVVNHGNDLIEKSQSDGISATLSNPHLTRVPHGPAVLEFHPGDQIFFSLDIVRPEGCFIDSSFRFAREDAPDAHTVWPVDGARVYAPAIKHLDHMSYSVHSPADLLPGNYKLTRSTSWLCGDKTTPIMNVMTLDLRILPANEPITQ